MWTAYVTVDDVDARTARVADAGGTVHAGPMDIPTVGRMAIIQDPTGGIIGIIQYENPDPGDSPETSGRMIRTRTARSRAAALPSGPIGPDGRSRQSGRHSGADVAPQTGAAPTARMERTPSTTA